ncbi:MAG: OsmC family protein [Nanoarchaeota archaeon]|nr:OsmC family protein [Nanoarchaeota archaeon]
MGQFFLEFKGDGMVVESLSENNNPIVIDATNDFGGQGKYHSPTELLCSSLVSCILIMMKSKADQLDISLDSMKVRVDYSYRNNKIYDIHSTFSLDNYLSESQKKDLIAQIQYCPIHHAISKDIELYFDFKF